MIDSKGNINRVAFDTYPEKFVYDVNGDKVDVSDWNVFLNYREAQGTVPETFKNIKITGVKHQFNIGEVRFYPRELYCEEFLDNGSLVGTYTGFNKVGTHDFMTTREKTFYYADDVGLYVIGNELVAGVESYILYDEFNPLHEGLQRFSTYVEKMTHASGTITIEEKVGI